MFLVTFILLFSLPLVFLHKEDKGYPADHTFKKSEDTETGTSPAGECQREGALLGLPEPTEAP